MKPQVLIYYANETSVDLRRLRGLEERIEQLRCCRDQTARGAADRVDSDLHLFPLTTYQQVVELQRVARDHGTDAQLAGAVVFDNETARCGWFELQDAGGYRSRKVPFREVTACHRLLEDNPLSGPSALKAAFKAVAGLYSPEDHEFILVTRSHGTDVMAMTLGLLEATLDRAVAVNPELRCKLGFLIEPDLSEARDFGVDGLGINNLGLHRLGPTESALGSNGLGEGGLGGEVGLGDGMPGLGQVGLGTDGQVVLGGKGLVLGTPELAKEGVGITKQAYLDIMEEAGNDLGMQFSLVFMDSCGSDIPCELAREVPPNVRMLFGSNEKGLGYDVPDYALLGNVIHVRDGIVGAIERLLERTINVTRFALEQEGKRLSVV